MPRNRRRTLLVLVAICAAVAGAVVASLGGTAAAQRERVARAGSRARVTHSLASRTAKLASRTAKRPSSDCPHPTIPVPPNEPVYRASTTTELVAGLYIQGGPIPPPPCKPKPRGPYAGTITVSNPNTGATVATKTVSNGHLAHIPLPPGSYKVSGRIAGGGSTSFSPTVTIKQGYKTRQDLFEDVP